MNKQHEFSEKISIVTDISNPIGRAIAMQLGLNGSFVVAGYSNKKDAGAHESLRKLGTLAETVFIDDSEETAKNLIDTTGQKFGRIDLLANTYFCEDETITAYFRSTKKFLEFLAMAKNLMNERPKIRILNVSYVPNCSDEIERTLFEGAAEAAASLVGSLSTNLPKKFSVNGIAIYDGEAEIAEAQVENELLRNATAVPADDAARVALFLLSSESKAVNGLVLDLN
ncbi:MAG: SDR family oxidoreductase [Pyrinomonadaceae bacterium]